MNIQDELTIKQRLSAPMPRFFRIIRNGGIILAAVAGALIGVQHQGIELPQVLTVVADKAYALAGLVLDADRPAHRRRGSYQKAERAVGCGPSNSTE